jgi:selenide,water dikinase
MTDLVLIGGGHSHAIALKLWGMKPLPGVRLSLITDVAHTPYSGMLPGYVAGFYTFEETHIDLRHLASFASAELYLDSAIALDLANHQVICKHHPPISFDYLSIDIGSTPTTEGIPGASQYAIPAKPVPQFLQAWQQILTSVEAHPERALTISIVGGGAGGVELCLNMQSPLHQLLEKGGQSLDNLTIHLFHRDKKLLANHNSWVSQRLERILRDRGVILHLSERVAGISPTEIAGYQQVICQSGLIVNSDCIFWVTQAAAPDWIRASGIATDSRGFILVSNTLQSLSHPHIFASGDIATIQGYPRPKAGVFAVRQGKPLWENLQALILGKPLKSYIPQQRYLSIIGTGDKSAIASWSFWGWQSPLLWCWKDRIDRQFMQQFYSREQGTGNGKQ